MRELRPGEAYLILGAREQHRAIVSAEDYPELSRWRWTFKVSSWAHGSKVYGRRCIWVDGKKKTILLHDVILRDRMGVVRPSDVHTADHINRDSLDNVRGNLRWACKSEQNKNRTMRQKSKVNVAEVLASYSEAAE